MTSENPSLLRSRHVVIRAREICVLPDGRRIAPHGLYGSLHVLEHRDALRLLEAGAIKAPAQVKRSVLRDHCERHAV